MRNKTHKIRHSYKLYKKKFGGSNNNNGENNYNNENNDENNNGANNNTSDTLIMNLYDAIQRGNYDMVKTLIDDGANPNGFSDTQIDSPLYEACRINTEDGHKIVKLLLEKRASPIIYNEITRYTPLHEACKNMNSKAVELLLNGSNADNEMEKKKYRETYNIYTNLISVQEKIDNKTALYMACENGDVKTVKVFLKSFNNIDITSTFEYEDKSIYEHARNNKFSTDINNLIIQYHDRPRNRINNNNYNNNNNNNNNINIGVGLENALLREEQARRDPIINLGENLNIRKNTIHQLKKSQQKCFDPIMYNNVNITNDVAVFYIMGATDKITHIGCYDDETLEKYKTSNDVLYYKCKSSIPITATMIIKNSVEPVGYRKLNFAFDVYVNSKQLQKVTVGKTYILRKTDKELGQIASYAVIMGGTAISAEHCGTKYKDKIYDIREATIVEHRKIHGKKHGTRKTHRGMIHKNRKITHRRK